jgi:hypothetical protein
MRRACNIFCSRKFTTAPAVQWFHWFVTSPAGEGFPQLHKEKGLLHLRQEKDYYLPHFQHEKGWQHLLQEKDYYSCCSGLVSLICYSSFVKAISFKKRFCHSSSGRWVCYTSNRKFTRASAAEFAIVLQHGDWFATTPAGEWFVTAPAEKLLATAPAGEGFATPHAG